MLQCQYGATYLPSPLVFVSMSPPLCLTHEYDARRGHAVDLVETGETMRAAGLEVVGEIMETEAVLIGNPKSTHKVRPNVLRAALMASTLFGLQRCAECTCVSHSSPVATRPIPMHRNHALSVYPMGIYSMVRSRVLLFRSSLSAT